jgi:hypothetical protein
MRRSLLLFLIGIVLVLPVVPHGVDASKGWCRSDPLVSLDGDWYAITASTDEYLSSAIYTVRSPPGTDVSLIREWFGIAASENTVFTTGVEGSRIKISLATVAATGTSPTVKLVVARQSDGLLQIAEGPAGTTLSVYYTP